MIVDFPSQPALPQIRGTILLVGIRCWKLDVDLPSQPSRVSGTFVIGDSDFFWIFLLFFELCVPEFILIVRQSFFNLNLPDVVVVKTSLFDFF